MAIQYFKRCAAQRRMKGSVIPVLRKREPAVPLRRARMNEAAKEGFETLVDALGLATGLWVVGGAQPQR